MLDGHGENGEKAAALFNQYFLAELRRLNEEGIRPPGHSTPQTLTTHAGDLEIAVKQAVNVVHQLFVSSQDFKHGGTTVVGFLRFSDDEVTVFHTGDSTAVLYKKLSNGKYKAKQLTKPHTAKRKIEAKRIKAIPGTHVIDDSDGYILLDGCALSMSRSVGDAHFDEAGVICEPEVTTFTIADGDLIALYSDGVGNVLGKKKVLKVFVRSLREQEAIGEQDFAVAAAAVCKLAALCWFHWSRESYKNLYGDDQTLAIMQFAVGGKDATEQQKAQQKTRSRRRRSADKSELKPAPEPPRSAVARAPEPAPEIPGTVRTSFVVRLVHQHYTFSNAALFFCSCQHLFADTRTPFGSSLTRTPFASGRNVNTDVRTPFASGGLTEHSEEHGTDDEEQDKKMAATVTVQPTPVATRVATPFIKASDQSPSEEVSPKTATIRNLSSALKNQADASKAQADAAKAQADASKAQADAAKLHAAADDKRADADKFREEQALLRLQEKSQPPPAYGQQPPPSPAYGGPMPQTPAYGQQQPPPPTPAYGGPMPPTPVFGNLPQQSVGNFPPSGQQLGAPPSSTQSTGVGGQQTDQSAGAGNQDNPASGRQPTVAGDPAPANPWPRPQLHNSFSRLEPSDPWGFHVEDATHTVTARNFTGAPAIVLGRRPAPGVMRLLVRKSDGTFTVFNTSKFESRA